MGKTTKQQLDAIIARLRAELERGASSIEISAGEALMLIELRERYEYVVAEIQAKSSPS